MAGRAFLLAIFLAASAAAQLDPMVPSQVDRVRVHVAFSNSVPCDAYTHVSLIGRDGPVAEGFTDSHCTVEFRNVPSGNYHLAVSGRNFPMVDTGAVAVDSGLTRDLEVNVTRPGEPARTSQPSTSTVGVADLSIPAAAAKEFDKANESIAKQDWPKAIERLDKAVAIYPSYVAAYNNLGVVYARLGDRAKENEVLQKAINLNDHFAPAYVNLGRMSLSTNDFAAAESELSKAAALDPNDGMTLVLLTYAEFMNKHADEAIASCRRAHSLSQPHAFVHFVAGRALEQEHKPVEAQAELKQFLREEQTGARADAARKELAQLQAITH